MRTLAIGDMHGCLHALETLVECVRLGMEDTVVTLGDYVDRGPDACGVIEFLIGLAGVCRLVPLRGNHEVMMREARLSRRSLAHWMHPAVGGGATLDSYQASSFGDVPPPHWQFLEECRSYHETGTHLFVHAYLDPQLAPAAQNENTLLWDSLPRRPAPHQSGKVLVCGHTTQFSGQPLSFGHTICIDTNACDGGWLTCLDVGSGAYWQANQKGRTRRGKLAQ